MMKRRGNIGRAASWLPALLIILGPAVFPAETGGSDAPVWEKAVSLAARNTGWVPSEAYIRVEELNRYGLVKNLRETWTKLVLSDSGIIQSEVVKVLKNGEDITEEVREKQRKKAADMNRERESTVRVTTPFDPDSRNDVTFSATGERRMISGSLCAGFDFTQAVRPPKGKSFSLRGKTWLEEVTGAPLLMTFTLDPLPPAVKMIETSVRFEFQGENRWFPKTVVTEISAGFLFIKKRLRTQMEFGGYDRKEREKTIAGEAGGD